MALRLDQVVGTLRSHAGELRRRGVVHAYVFGSVARGEADDASDIDVLVDLDGARRLSLFDFAGINAYLDEVFGVPVDLGERTSVKPRLRPFIDQDLVNAF
jgi:predicted nucleotidyltransferase